MINRNTLKSPFVPYPNRLKNICECFKNIKLNHLLLDKRMKDSIILYPVEKKDSKKAKKILINIIQHCISETDGLSIDIEVDKLGYKNIHIQLWDCSA